MGTIKKSLLLIGGICWILFSLGFAFLLMQCIGAGVGLSEFDMAVSSGSVLLGLILVVGLATAAVLCFAIGVVMCAHGLARAEECKGGLDH